MCTAKLLSEHGPILSVLLVPNEPYKKRLIYIYIMKRVPKVEGEGERFLSPCNPTWHQPRTFCSSLIFAPYVSRCVGMRMFSVPFSVDNLILMDSPDN